jgi:hypothetical protein
MIAASIIQSTGIGRKPSHNPKYGYSWLWRESAGIRNIDSKSAKAFNGEAEIGER